MPRVKQKKRRHRADGKGDSASAENREICFREYIDGSTPNPGVLVCYCLSNAYLYCMPNQAVIIENIKTLFEREDIPAKSILVREGDVVRKLYYIEKGLVRIFFYHDGRDVTFQFLTEGQFISSFESLLNNEPSWYSIETLEPVTVYSTSATSFREKMDRLPHVKEFYYQYLQERLLTYQKLFIARIKDNPEKRYRDLLEKSPEIILRVPQHYIASYLGITSVSLSRIRNRK